MNKPVADLDFRSLGLVRPEQMIPDQQHAAVILVEIFGVAGMMDAMRRRRIDDPLQPTNVRHQLGMHEKLLAQAQRHHAVDPYRNKGRPYLPVA